MKLIIDLETTGLHHRSAGIVEIAAVAVRDGAIHAEWSSLCYPGYAYVCEPCHWHVLTKVSGISPALLLDAPTLEEAGELFAAWAAGVMADGPLPATSYNRAFDQPFARAHLPRVEERLDWQGCLMLRAQKALGLSKWPSLSRACELLGIARDGEHRALADARCAARLAIALEGRG